MTIHSASLKPQPLPYCTYPTAQAVAQHGLQPLPDELPVVNFLKAQVYGSQQYQGVRAATLNKDQLLQMARGVGQSFAQREPMSRHLHLPKYPPVGLENAIHTDPLSVTGFGDWTTENMIAWFIRLFLLTDPTQPTPLTQLNADVLRHSVAIVDSNDQVMGGAFNETAFPMPDEPVFRPDDVFLTTVLTTLDPILSLLGGQNAEAMAALCEAYPAFQAAYQQGRVGHHFMIARFDDLPTLDAFELVARTAAFYHESGYEYLVTEATNQWTGAAFEALGALRVHFAPFQAQKTVGVSPEPVEDEITSRDGFIASKDSGSMFYVLRLH